MQRRRRGDDHEGDAAEEDDGDQAAGGEAEGVVDQPVALHRVADLELHDRHAGELPGELRAAEVERHRLADLADERRSAPRLPAIVRLERQHDQRQLCRPRTGACRAGSRSTMHPLDELVVSGALRQRLGEERAGEAGRRSAASRAENSEMMPRVPSTSCRSVTRLRMLFERIALEQRLALHHDQHVEFAGGEAPRDLLDTAGIPGCRSGRAGSSESSTLMRTTPKPAAIASRMVTISVRSGKRSGTSPIRSIPKARRWRLRRRPRPRAACSTGPALPPRQMTSPSGNSARRCTLFGAGVKYRAELCLLRPNAAVGSILFLARRPRSRPPGPGSHRSRKASG